MTAKRIYVQLQLQYIYRQSENRVELPKYAYYFTSFAEDGEYILLTAI